MALSDAVGQLAFLAKEAETRAASTRAKARTDLEQEVASARAAAEEQVERLRQAAEEGWGKISERWTDMHWSWMDADELSQQPGPTA
jgi:F0F1-type ATP synthase membrane subunit b/b'